MLNKLTEIVRKYTGDDSIVLEENTVLIGDLGLNSFDLASLACDVEDEFDVEIPDRAIKDFKTVSDIMEFVEAQ